MMDRLGESQQGPWKWCWFDSTPMGPTYGVRRADEVICYARLRSDAEAIAAAMNQFCPAREQDDPCP